jgi:hypothetical protein
VFLDIKISTFLIKYLLVRFSCLKVSFLVICDVLSVLSILVKVCAELLSGFIFSKSVQMQPVRVHARAHLSEIIELDLGEVAKLTFRINLE